MKQAPLVTVVVPSFNQERYLEDALRSIVGQDVPAEIIVMDGGSTDGSVAIIERWSDQLFHWQSKSDGGQAAAINAGVDYGRAPYVCWLNSDDLLYPGGLGVLIAALEKNRAAPAAFGQVDHLDDATGLRRPAWVEPFDEKRLALRCIVSQPGTVIRRSSWQAVRGLDPKLHFAMDYDLWWRLYRRFGPFAYVSQTVAVNRNHRATKTRNNRKAHYSEAMTVVRRNYGRIPLKWWLAQPYAVWWKSIAARLGR
ncbi:glycosyltransferase family 2 protein [Mesorhizobium sp.]|uniref:glycosyltransferase family 2 protein n=1 Tax=Mesorhizobium sp. TaxID=1871066 RepID=UPI000FE7F866|nr:glycosyltransferase family 2 protein [Mesorhizobium sp.]RWB56745.1 MAG: glycosyltransferase [Mesorhizobium sp.]